MSRKTCFGREKEGDKIYFKVLLACMKNMFATTLFRFSKNKKM